jgi:hypothetical protein
MFTDIEMRCAAMAAERGASLLPSTTVAGDYTIINAVDSAVINADATLDDCKSFCAIVDPTLAE